METKKIALTAGIAVLFVLFIVFLVDAVYEQPKYDEYCNQTYYPEPLPLGVQQNCSQINAQKIAEQCYKDKGEVRYKYDSKGCPEEAHCDYCSKKFHEESSKYNKNIFYISAIIGIITILTGLYLPKILDAIASGFMFGGILVLIQGTFRVFGDLSKTLIAVILGIELIILVWIGYKKVKDKK